MTSGKDHKRLEKLTALAEKCAQRNFPLPIALSAPDEVSNALSGKYDDGAKCVMPYGCYGINDS